MNSVRLALWLLPLVLAVASAAESFNVKSVIDFAAHQYDKLVHQIALGRQYPNSAHPTQTHWSINNNPTSTHVDWTDGFFPGVLWQLYNHTKNETWKEQAMVATHGLEKQQYNTGTHDIGFLVLIPYGDGYQLAKVASFPRIIENAANHLAVRYNS